MRRLLPALSPRVTLFLNSPLDENARKLWALKWAPALAALTGQLAGGSERESCRGSSSNSSSRSSSSSNPCAQARVQVDIGAVRIFASRWVNESLFPRWLVVDPASPKGEQVRREGEREGRAGEEGGGERGASR